MKIEPYWYELHPLNDSDFDKLPDISGFPVYINFRDGVIRVWPKDSVPYLKFACSQ